MIMRFVNRLEEGAISLLLVGMTLLIFFEVILRFAFNTGMVWADELVLHMSAWMVLLGASYGVKAGSHIGVDALVKIMPRMWQRLVTLAAVALCLIYCALLLEGSWVYLKKMYKIGVELEDLPVPKYIAHSILLIGFALLAIRFALLAWQVLSGRSDSFKFADEAREAMETLDVKEAEKISDEKAMKP
jgi:C4-dicarboxylate transporter DctQ subunit